MTTRVTGGLIAAQSVASAHIADGAVTTDKLAAANVTAATIADGAVSAAKLAAAIKPEILVATVSQSNAASIDVTGFDPALYRSYRIELERVFPATAAQAIWLRTSGNAGASYDAGASDYAFVPHQYLHGVGTTGTTSVGSDRINLSGNSGVDAAADRGATGEIRIVNPGAAQRGVLHWQIGAFDTSGQAFQVMGTAWRLNSLAIGGVRILAASGNVSGTARLYGTRV